MSLLDIRIFVIKTLHFAREFLRTPRTVGAILPTSSFFVKAMLDASRLESADVVVELGPGTGVFTREIIKRLRPNASFFCIEANPKFCRQLQPLFTHCKNGHLVCASASDLPKLLEEHGHQQIDTVISALPYNNLPRSMSREILKGVGQNMREESEFFTILYSRSCRPLFAEFFPYQDWRRVYLNIPPAYLVKMTL